VCQAAVEFGVIGHATNVQNVRGAVCVCVCVVVLLYLIHCLWTSYLKSQRFYGLVRFLSRRRTKLSRCAPWCGGCYLEAFKWNETVLPALQTLLNALSSRSFEQLRSFRERVMRVAVSHKCSGIIGGYVPERWKKKRKYKEEIKFNNFIASKQNTQATETYQIIKRAVKHSKNFHGLHTEGDSKARWLL
jgi:hypothetical protein